MRDAWLVAAVLTLGLTLGPGAPAAGAADAGAGHAGAPCPDAGDWIVQQGSLAAGARCGEWLLASNMGNTRFSYGELRFARDVPLPFELEVTWRRLGPEQKPLELLVPGAVVMLAEDRYGLYVDDARFAADGWRDRPGFSVHRRSTVRVRRDRAGVTLWIDGERVERWALATDATVGRPGLGFKGAAAYRSRLWLGGVAVRTAQ